MGNLLVELVDPFEESADPARGDLTAILGGSAEQAMPIGARDRSVIRTTGFERAETGTQLESRTSCVPVSSPSVLADVGEALPRGSIAHLIIDRVPEILSDGELVGVFQAVADGISIVPS